MRVGAVVLTTGARPGELAAAVRSIDRQRDVEVEVVIVLNRDEDEPPAGSGLAPGPGTPMLPDLPSIAAPVRVLTPGRNLGIPAGRNLGASALPEADLLLFLDDDATLASDDVLVQAARHFAADPSLGAITMRITDPATGVTERRHVPRLRVGDPSSSSWVTTLLGGACIVRADAYRQVGGLPGEFFFAHEETSLAWRLLDHDFRLRYEGGLVVHHPESEPASRHATFHHLTARNRVLLARMHLPWPLAVVYLMVWVVLGLARAHGGRAVTLAGFVDGLRARDVARAPMRWRTAARMARWGRPPII